MPNNALVNALIRGGEFELKAIDSRCDFRVMNGVHAR